MRRITSIDGAKVERQESYDDVPDKQAFSGFPVHDIPVIPQPPVKQSRQANTHDELHCAIAPNFRAVVNFHLKVFTA